MPPSSRSGRPSPQTSDFNGPAAVLGWSNITIQEDISNMARSYARLFAVIFCLAIALGFVGPAGVAHAEPGPRPTLTPIPPMAEPVVVPEEEAEPVPTGRPRRTFRVVLTPVAPVQATALPESVTDLMIQPSVQDPDVQVRYVVPGQAVSGVAAVASPRHSRSWEVFSFKRVCGFCTEGESGVLEVRPRPWVRLLTASFSRPYANVTR